MVSSRAVASLLFSIISSMCSQVLTFSSMNGFRMSSSFQNDSLGCNSISWAPYSALGSIMEDGSSVRRLVTGSCDNSVRIWAFNVQLNKWQEESKQSSPHKGLYAYVISS